VSKPRKKKLRTIPQEMESAAIALQRLVRLKAADQDGFVVCVTCGIKRQWDDRMQGGHFISRRYTETKLQEENVHVQCYGCNGPLSRDGSVTVKFTLYMVDMYGRTFVNAMIAAKETPAKYTRSQIAELKAGFDKRIRELEEKL